MNTSVLLFLNGIGTGELLVIGFFFLMFFGSKSLPGVAKNLGKGIRQVRDASDEIKREINTSTTNIRKEIEDNRKEITQNIDPQLDKDDNKEA